MGSRLLWSGWERCCHIHLDFKSAGRQSWSCSTNIHQAEKCSTEHVSAVFLFVNKSSTSLNWFWNILSILFHYAVLYLRTNIRQLSGNERDRDGLAIATICRPNGYCNGIVVVPSHSAVGVSWSLALHFIQIIFKCVYIRYGMGFCSIHRFSFISYTSLQILVG